MNILLTRRCNNSCRYCFANEFRSGSEEISLADFEYVLDFLKRSDFRELKLSGGEPTLHSRFEELLEIAVEDDFFEIVTVFTNGLIENRELFPLLASPKVVMIINCNSPSEYTEQNWCLLTENLSTLGEMGAKIIVSHNIHRLEFDHSYLLGLIETCDALGVRWSLANPTASKRNLYVDVRDYQQISDKIVNFVVNILSIDIPITSDCPLPICTFTDEQIQTMMTAGIGKLGFVKIGKCSPVIDVGPDLRVSRCFAVYPHYTAHLADFGSLEELEKYYLREVDEKKWSVPTLDACKTCLHHYERECQGGCLGFQLDRILANPG